MSGLKGLPEGSVIDAIWRCKRGHERPAAYHSPLLTVNTLVELTYTDMVGERYAICMACLVEDYEMTRVDFKDES